MKIGLRSATKFKDLAAFAIPFDAEQDLILCISTLPAGAFWVKIGWATRIHIFGTVREILTGYFPVPEV